MLVYATAKIIINDPTELRGTTGPGPVSHRSPTGIPPDLSSCIPRFRRVGFETICILAPLQKPPGTMNVKSNYLFNLVSHSIDIGCPSKTKWEAREALVGYHTSSIQPYWLSWCIISDRSYTVICCIAVHGFFLH